MGLQEDLQASLDKLDEAINHERSADDPERTMRLIFLGFIVGEAKKTIASLQKEAAEILLNSDWDRNPFQNQHFSMETKTGQPRKKWDHDSLAVAVAKRISDSSIDMDTGEVLKSTQQMIKELLEYAAPSYWRVGALRELGIDPDDYCDVGEPITNLIYRSNNV